MPALKFAEIAPSYCISTISGSAQPAIREVFRSAGRPKVTKDDPALVQHNARAENQANDRTNQGLKLTQGNKAKAALQPIRLNSLTEADLIVTS